MRSVSPIVDQYGRPIDSHGVVAPSCDHGVTFDEEAARGLDAGEVKRRWPRGWGLCPKGCGYNGIAYASYAHYISGDW